jgi:hypothetical protein
VEGDQMQISDRRGLKIIPDGWYRYKTWPDQPFPWIVSDRIRLLRPLLQNEVKAICTTHGVKIQPVDTSHCHSDDISEKNKSVRFPVPDAVERMSHSKMIQCNYDVYIIID